MPSSPPRPGAREPVSKRVNGTYVVIGLVTFTGLFGLAFWWFQSHAFYSETKADEHTVIIDGVGRQATGRVRGAEAGALLMGSVCLQCGEGSGALGGPGREPLGGPGWFSCFNAEVRAENLASGYTKAYVEERNNPRGFDRIVAVFPGGRAYMWRQPNGILGE